MLSLVVLLNHCILETPNPIPLRRVVGKDRQAGLLGYSKYISTNGLYLRSSLWSDQVF